MPTTSNFGWTTPADTDLVKDGAAAIRTLGSAIDTSLVDLKGGTTGQVLAKNSNTDMDFVWTAGGDITEVTAGTGISGGGTSGAVTITNSMATAIDAKGDLIVGTGADTFSRLAVGTNDYVLTAASGESTGMKWAAVSASGFTAIHDATFSAVTTVDVTNIPQTYKFLVLQLTATCSNDGDTIRLRWNNDSNSNRHRTTGTKTTSGNTSSLQGVQDDHLQIIATADSTNYSTAYIQLFNYTSTNSSAAVGHNTSLNAYNSTTGEEFWNRSISYTGGAVTSLRVYVSSPHTITGTLKLWGAN